MPKSIDYLNPVWMLFFVSQLFVRDHDQSLLLFVLKVVRYFNICSMNSVKSLWFSCFCHILWCKIGSWLEPKVKWIVTVIPTFHSLNSWQQMICQQNNFVNWNNFVNFPFKRKCPVDKLVLNKWLGLILRQCTVLSIFWTNTIYTWLAIASRIVMNNSWLRRFCHRVK